MEQNHGVESTSQGSGGDIIFAPFDSLPEECISNIISFTSPRDACVVASVSRAFELAAKSDMIWEKFLPLDYSFLVPRSRDFLSKKEIFFDLCYNPVLIEDGKMSFFLDKASGKKCIMLSAMNMTIIQGEIPRNWKWIQIPESRFEKVAELLGVDWFEICGIMNTSFLSPRTRYSAYILFKKTMRSYGFTDEAIEAVVEVVGHEPSKRLVCFGATKGIHNAMRDIKKNIVKPEGRADGWMEIELGDFFNEGEFDETEMSVFETEQHKSKGGLIIQGIEIRPTKIE